MAKVLTHTPSWLSRPAPGFNVFQPTDKQKSSTPLSNGYGKKVETNGPARLLVHRGTEIIFVVGNEIRWADLLSLKEGQEVIKQENGVNQQQGSYKVLKAPVGGQIRQLVISPLGDYLAIATSHTVHLAILPSTFETDSNEPIRLKTFQVGPTAHVLEQAPIASLLWHPLGALGTCLVTVATDACVRLWELNKDSRRSFDEPTLALDLKKLANAGSYGEDMRASVYGTSKGFSPDQVEMEVAAATFGGIGTADEYGWAAMTLWIVMTEGDVYALCPLVPSKWQPSASTIPSLSTSVVSKTAILDQDDEVPEALKRRAVQQQKWLADLDVQEPIVELLPGGLETVEIYNRPTHPPAVPKLQGPFRLHPEPDVDDISDIIAIAPRLDNESYLEEAEDEYGEELARSGLSIGMLCLLTRSGDAHICLDVSGVEATWLPSRRGTFSAPVGDDGADLVLLETVQLCPEAGLSWPSFTPNLPDRYVAANPLFEQQNNAAYSFFVTTTSGVYSLDVSTWAQNLEDEIAGPSDTGTSFRMGILFDSDRTTSSTIVTFAQPGSFTAAVTIADSDLGHFLLTTSSDQPWAATLETQLPSPFLSSFAPDTAPLVLGGPEIRQAYQPPAEFFHKSQLLSSIDQMLHSGATRLQRTDLTSQLRLSPATLQLLTEAHRILSEETNNLGLAAADLFRRCQRMQAELAEQVRRVREVRARADGVTQDESGASNRAKIERRIVGVREREAKLQARIDDVRRKVAELSSGKDLSKKEEAWAGEVKRLEETLEGELGKRVEDVKVLKERLVEETEEIKGSRSKEEDDRAAKQGGTGVSADIRRKKLDHVMALLERETALVDAVSHRLERLAGLAGR